MNLLEVSNLRIAFRRGRQLAVEAVKGVSFSVPRNATVALVGESGSGKSVSSLAVMGLLPKDSAVVDEVLRLHLGMGRAQARPADVVVESRVHGGRAGG